MKKLGIVWIFLFCLFINVYQAIAKSSQINEMRPSNLNSKDLLSYIEKNNLQDNLYKVCSQHICIDINSSNLERNYKKFIEKNIEYLQNKNEEQAIEASLKGFKIEKIILYS